MFVVAEGQKIRNVKLNGGIVTLQAGDAIPSDYVIPLSYISNKIVIEKKKGGSK